MADISTGRQRGIVPFVDETTGRLPDQYLPQGVIDLQGDLEQAVSDASQSATAAKASETAAKASAESATQSASAAAQSAESASGDASAAKESADGAASSASAAKASETAAARSAQTATEQVSSIGDSVERAAASATAAAQSASQAQSNATAANSSAQAAAASAESAQTATESAASSKDAAARSASEASESAQAAEASKTNAAASATAAQNAVDGFGLEVGTTTTGEPGTDASVNITKQGTKYVADFTIPTGAQGPKGDPGDLTTVAHDATLDGDGTSGNPLKVNNFRTLDNNVDFNTVRTFGIYLKKWGNSATNTPLSNSDTQYLLLVNVAGNWDTADATQVIAPMGGANGGDKIYFRYYSQSQKWSDWKQLVTTDYLSNYVTLSTYQALEAKVQALETKTTYKLITTGTDLHTLFGTNGNYMKIWGTAVTNGPNSVANGESSTYLITVVSRKNDGYMRIDPIAGITDSYYLQKINGTITSWYKITATAVTE